MSEPAYDYESHKELILKKIYDGLGWAIDIEIKVFVKIFARECCEKCSVYDNKIYDPIEFVNAMPIPNQGCYRKNGHCCAGVMVISEQKAKRDKLI